jgi:hypothetical protein
MRQRRDGRHDEALDVSASPELLHLAEEVRSTGRPRALRRGGETLAVFVPFSEANGRQGRWRTPTAEDIERFWSAAGSWADVDVDRFLEDVYAARDVVDERPPVEL